MGTNLKNKLIEIAALPIFIILMLPIIIGTIIEGLFSKDKDLSYLDDVKWVEEHNKQK